MITYDYVVTLTADVSPREAFLTYIDTHLMKDWQPNLKRIETEKGALFQKGSRGYLIYETNGQELKMSVDVHLCESHIFDVTYRMNGVENRCINAFVKENNGLLWKMIVTFKFDYDDIPKQSVFVNQTKQNMQQFIDYLKQK